ncbi:MAG: cadherin domain-containing protein [Deltaproteobacteria bacterium]|nr:cadherin domain-containing protein [Deltaproteobacteria bacterium]
MNKDLSRRPHLGTHLLLAMVLLLPNLAHAGGSVSLNLLPDTTEVSPGEIVNLDVVVSDLGDGATPSLGAFDVSLSFEPTLFEFVGVVPTLDLGDPALLEAIEVSVVNAGSSDSFVLSLLPPADLIANQSDTVYLFSATFQALEAGAGEFDLSLLAPLSDELGQPLDVNPIEPVTVISGSIVEIPTLGDLGLLLLVMALAVGGFFTLQRRNRRDSRWAAMLAFFFVLATPALAMPGDIDGDGDVDIDDIDLILAANGTAVGAGDVRDLDADGLITVLDMRQAVVHCSRSLCARNVAPAVNPPANQTTNEDTATGPLPFTADDADGDSLILSFTSSDPTLIPVTNLTLGGSQPNFTVDVLPAAGQNGGPVTITITADDGFTTSLASFEVTVNAVNDPPVITTSNAFPVPENQTGVTDVESTDKEGDTEGAGLSYTLTGTLDDALFALDADTGVLAFLAAPNFENPIDTGADNIYDLEVTVTDSGGETDVQAIAVTVVGVNECPTAIDDALATDEDSVVNGDLLAANPTTADSDPEGDSLSITAINGNAANVGTQIPLGNGLLTVDASGTVSFDPDGGYDDLGASETAQESFSYTLDDGSGSCAETATVTLTITGINDSPAITTGSTFSVPENQTAVTDVESTDPEGDTEGAGLSYTLTGAIDDALFSLDADTGVLVFLAAPDFENPGDTGTDNIYDLEVTVTDSGGETDVRAIAVTVNGVNDCPTAVDDAFSTDEDTVLNGDLLAANPTTADSDPEGDTLTVTAINGVAANIGVQIPLGAGLLTVNANGTLSFDPNSGYQDLSPGETAQEIFTYTLDDGSGTCTETATVTLIINGIDDPPEITTGGAFSVPENQIAVTDVDSTDPEGDTEGSGLTYALTGTIDDGLFSIDADTGVLTFQAAPDFENPGDTGGNNVYDLEVTVTDSSGEADIQTIAVTVTGVNECPTAVGDALATDEDTTLNGNVLAANPTTADSDPDGDGLTVTAVSGNPANVGVQIPLGAGLLTVNANGTLSFDPNGGYDDLSAGESAQETFPYTIDDGSSTCAETATVTITINGVNDVPMITSDGGGATAAVGAAEGQIAVSDVQSVDPDGDTEGSGLTYSITGGADQVFFLIDPDTGVLTLTTPIDFERPTDPDGNGVLEVEITVTDSLAATDVQLLTVTISDINDPPSLVAGTPVFVTDEVFTRDLPLGLLDAQVVTVSSDGEFVYTGGEDFLTVWQRNRATGDIVFVETFEDDENGIDGLADPGEFLISPDGRHFYVTSRRDFSVSLFDRNVTTGELTYVESLYDGQGDIPPLAIEGAEALAVSPDGLNVYVGTELGRRIAVFSRNPLDGRLTLVQVVRDGTDAPGIFHVVSIAVSSGGDHVYTAADLDDTVSVFNRDSATGELTFVEEHRDGVGAVTTLDQATRVELSPDEKFLYAAARKDDALTVFSRNDDSASPNYGRLTLLQSIRNGDGGGTVNGLTDPEDLRLSKDGRHVYTTGQRFSNDGSMPTFARDPATGLLTFLGTLFDGTNGANNLRGLVELASSDDSRHIYAVSENDFSLTVLSREATRAIFQMGGPRILLLPPATDLTVNDPDDTDLVSVEVTITNLLNAGQELLAASAGTAPNIEESDIQYVAPTLTIAPAGGAPLDDFEEVLSALSYTNLSGTPDFSERIIEITANDGTDNSNTYTVRVTLQSAAPVITSDGGGDTATINVLGNTTAVTDVQATDADGDTEGAGLTYNITDSDGNGELGDDNRFFTIVPTTGVLTFLVAPDFSDPQDRDFRNTYEVQVTVTDSTGTSDVQDITVRVIDPGQ